MNDPRKPIFDSIRVSRGRGFDYKEVAEIDSMLDRLAVPRNDIIPPAPRRINNAGLALIKEFEGCKLTAYRDAVGILTIGYGSTGAHVKPGMKITQGEAEALLRADLDRFENAVSKMAPTATDNQFAALVSLAFNAGAENLRTSTLLKKHLAGDHEGAKAEFARWKFAGGKVLNGLVRRRAAEASLYSTP